MESIEASEATENRVVEEKQLEPIAEIDMAEKASIELVSLPAPSRFQVQIANALLSHSLSLPPIRLSSLGNVARTEA